MSIRKLTVGSGAVVFSSLFVLFTYGCVAEPADSGDDNTSGTGGVMNTGGAGPTGGVAGTPASGAGGTTPLGGTGGTAPTAGSGATPTGGASGAAAGGASGASTGGVAGVGPSGAGGTPMGGGGAGGTPASGAGGMPGGTGSGGGAGGALGGVNTDAMCKSISNNMACTAAVGDGKMCPMMPCGLGDVGRRDCNCQVNWSCTSCSFVGTVIETRPANADTACGADVVAGMPCAMNPDSAASVCKSTSTTDPYCMCASNPRNTAEPPEWNCDSKPGPWPM